MGSGMSDAIWHVLVRIVITAVIVIAGVVGLIGFGLGAWLF